MCFNINDLRNGLRFTQRSLCELATDSQPEAADAESISDVWELASNMAGWVGGNGLRGAKVGDRAQVGKTMHEGQSSCRSGSLPGGLGWKGDDLGDAPVALGLIGALADEGGYVQHTGGLGSVLDLSESVGVGRIICPSTGSSGTLGVVESFEVSVRDPSGVRSLGGLLPLLSILESIGISSTFTVFHIFPEV